MYTMSFVRRIRRNGRIYLAEVENRWIKGKCVQRHLRYVGREADGQTLLATSISEARIDSVKLYGPLMVLHHLADEIGLAAELGDHGHEILSMVYAHCLDYQSLNHMPQWFERTDLNMILDLEGLTEKRLLGALDSMERLDSEALQQRLFETVCRRYHVKPSAVVYDVTTPYLYGRRCPLGKLGHDKEGVQGRPLVQIGLSVTQEEGFPLFHKVFDGNVHDARTLQDLVGLFGRYDLSTGLFIYDRGITSGRNLQDIKALKWDTLCGVPIHNALKRFWRTEIQPRKLTQLSYRHRVGGNVFYAISQPYQIDRVKGHLALCFNERQHRDLRESRYDDVLCAEKLLAQGKTIKAGLEKYFDPQGRLQQDALVRAEEFDGYSCLFCTRPMPTRQMLSLYFNKDIVEKAFRSLKGITQLRPIRHWLAERVQAHVFLCYLAYLLLSLLQYRLRKTEFTAEHALDELATLYKVYLRDVQNRFQLSRLVSLTKNQERILKTIDPTLLNS
jgi:transposase